MADEPAFSHFKPLPMLPTPRSIQRRDHSRQSAGEAIRIGVVARNRPIAYVFLAVIAAKAIASLDENLRCGNPKVVAFFVERRHVHLIG